MIQLTLTLKMTTTQDVETSVTVNNNSPIQDYVQTRTMKLNLTFDMTPGFKPFTVIKEFSIFLSHIRLQKQHSSLVYWLKICKVWVRSQWCWAWNWLKLNVTSSNDLRIIIHWLSARSDVGLTQGSLIPKEHSLYTALKYSIRQHKLYLNLSKTKQPLPIITNSHLNFRYLTASANL